MHAFFSPLPLKKSWNYWNSQRLLVAVTGSSDPLLLQMEEWTVPFPVLLHLLYKALVSEGCDLTHLCPCFSCFPLIPSILCSLSHLFPSFYPSLEGEESGRFIKASVWGSGQEKASLPAFVPSHPRSLASRTGCRGNRSHPASAPPSPSRPFRFLPHGVTGASRFLPHWERHAGGHRAGAFAQEVRFSGHQFPQVSPGNTAWQRTDGSPAWAQTLVKREVSSSYRFHTPTTTFDLWPCFKANRPLLFHLLSVDLPSKNLMGSPEPFQVFHFIQFQLSTATFCVTVSAASQISRPGYIITFVYIAVSLLQPSELIFPWVQPQVFSVQSFVLF